MEDKTELDFTATLWESYCFFLVFLVYTESEQVCEFYVTVPLGITHSKQLPPLAGPAKNEYIIHFQWKKFREMNPFWRNISSLRDLIIPG